MSLQRILIKLRRFYHGGGNLTRIVTSMIRFDLSKQDSVEEAQSHLKYCENVRWQTENEPAMMDKNYTLLYCLNIIFYALLCY